MRRKNTGERNTKNRANKQNKYKFRLGRGVPGHKCIASSWLNYTKKTILKKNNFNAKFQNSIEVKGKPRFLLPLATYPPKRIHIDAIREPKASMKPMNSQMRAP